MVVEALLAGLLGLMVLGLVLLPLVRGAPAPRPAEPPDAEETRRGQAVIALREIEFDRATGKLSDEDYAALKARYTAEAVAAGREERLEVEPDLEAMVAARREAVERGILAPECARCGPRPEPDAAFCSGCGDRLPTDAACRDCGAALPPGAAFCEQCGVRAA